ncbi:MAG TPA: hypothetical protein VE912_12585 [Bacteroidales bacterium]|nr:hypothetical protein [Bacteroidales bacterium]
MVWNAIVSIIAAWFTIQISFRKFSTQKWWERREQTYAEIVGILSSLLMYLDNRYEDVLRIRELSDTEKKELFAKLRDEKEKIELIAREGAFRISPKSTNALQLLVKLLNKYGSDPVKGIENHSKAVSECLETINSEAKIDLGIRKKWYKPWYTYRDGAT